MRKLLTKILSVIVAVTATLGLVMLPKTAVLASQTGTSEFAVVQGAGVRYGETLDETGLRFTIEVNKGWYATLGEGVVFGAIVTTKDYANSLGENFKYDANDEKIADTICALAEDYDSETHTAYYSTVTYKFNEEWVNELKEKYGENVDVEQMKLKALATELVCRPYYITAEGEYKYADVSNARSMVKVANSAIINKDPVPNKDYAAFQAKYIVNLTESTSEIYIERETGAIYGASEQDLAALTAENTTFTANGDASDVAFAIDNGKVADLSFFNNYEDGKEYYITAYTGYNVYRIKYVLATKFINEAEDLETFTMSYRNEHNEVNGYFVVTNNIDASNYDIPEHKYEENKNGGDAPYPGNGYNFDVGFYKSTLNGLGHTISNFTAKSNGLFGNMSSSHVINIAFTHVKLTGYYSCLFAASFSRGKTYDNQNWLDDQGSLKNLYVQIDDIEMGKSKCVGLLFNQIIASTVAVENVVVEYLGFEYNDANPLFTDCIKKGERFTTIGSSGYAYGETTYLYKNVYSISKAPLSSRGSSYKDANNVNISYPIPTFAENQVKYTVDGNKVVLEEVLDSRVNDIMAWLNAVKAESREVSGDHILLGVRTYDDYAKMSQDADANAASLATFDSKYWVIINNVPYWRSSLTETFDVVVKDVKNNILNDYVVKEGGLALTLELGNNPIPNAEVSAEEGITIDGNLISVSEGYSKYRGYEVTISAIVDGITVEKTITVYGYNRFVQEDVLYSKDDLSLDLPSLKKALASVDAEINSLEEIDAYFIDGKEVVGDLDLEVTILGDNYDRTVKSQELTIVLNNGATYTLRNVYAYTKLIDEAEDLSYFRLDYQGNKAAGKVTGQVGGVDQYYDLYTGYYLVTKNIDATNLKLADHTFNTNAIYPGGTTDGVNSGLTGVFDGNGHIISNLTTIRNGIFGTVYGALIKDIAFTDVDIKGSSYPCIIGHFGKSNNTTHKLKFSNIYVSVKSMASESSVLVNNGTDNSAILENIVIDYTAFGSKESGWLIGAGGRFGTVTDFTVNAGTGNYKNLFKNVYTITSSPVVALRTGSNLDYTDKTTTINYISALTVAGNQVTLNADGKTYTAKTPELQAILDKFTKTNVVTVKEGNVTYAKTYSDFVFNSTAVAQGIKSYANVGDMINDYANNSASYSEFNDCWVVKGDMIYWKEIYKQNFALQVKDGDNVLSGDIVLKDNSTELTLDILDMSGNPVESTITAPKGITVVGNTIKLTNVPTSVENYEILVKAEVEGMVIEKYVTITTEDVVDLVVTNNKGVITNNLNSLKDELVFKFVQDNGTEFTTTVSECEGLNIEGNVVKLANDPTSTGYYEVVVNGNIGGVEISEYFTINFTNEFTITDKMLYSQYDRSLDILTLNKAIEKLEQPEVSAENPITGYTVAGANSEELMLEVIISGTQNGYNRAVTTAQQVSVEVGGKVYNLSNVYAYTRLIDEVEDLSWFSKQNILATSEEYTGGDLDIAYTSSSNGYVYADYPGYYLVTRNLNGLQEDGTKYKLECLRATEKQGHAGTKQYGLTGVFDGNGYTISNVVVQSRGIFGRAYKGVIQNVAFKNVDLMGYYSALLAHELGGGGGYTSLIKNIYVEGTNITYTGSNGELALLAQNNFYCRAENVVVIHNPNDAEQKKALAGSRYGVFSTQYAHSNASMGNNYKDTFIIADMPIYSANSTNTIWGKVFLASNILKATGNTTPIAEGTKVEHEHTVEGVKAKYQCDVFGCYTEYELTGKNFAFLSQYWDSSKVSWFSRCVDDSYSMCPNAKNVLTKTWLNTYTVRLDIVTTIKQYATAKDMTDDATANATSLGKFDTTYWTVVDGIPTWKTLND